MFLYDNNWIENFERFQQFNLKQIFWRIKTFFKKLECCFLVESTKIENVSFPYKTAISETNLKTNRMVSTKWTHEERSFASNYFIILKFLFQFIFESLIKSWFDVPMTKMSIFILFVSAGRCWAVLLPCEYP